MRQTWQKQRCVHSQTSALGDTMKISTIITRIIYGRNGYECHQNQIYLVQLTQVCRNSETKERNPKTHKTMDTATAFCTANGVYLY